VARIRFHLLVALGLAIALGSASLSLRAQSTPRAWAIVGGLVADGLGGPLRHATVRIVGDRIAAVGTVSPQPGDTVVDATGLVVTRLH
jgi:imidazolonepropionase-like amidohydrolase